MKPGHDEFLFFFFLFFIKVLVKLNVGIGPGHFCITWFGLKCTFALFVSFLIWGVYCNIYILFGKTCNNNQIKVYLTQFDAGVLLLNSSSL